jgi:hypothetical protein
LNTRLALALALLAAPLATAPSAWAAQRPTEAEASRIGEVLTAQGYRDWDKVEMDDGLWEVDDAMDQQGTRRDLRLTPGEFRLIANGTENRLASTEETSAIQEALRREGFQRSGPIRLDDGIWEVDDAIMADGSRYDLKLETGSLRILHRDREG